MIPASRRRNYLQSALYVAIAGVLTAVLLERLLTYAEAYEKAQVEVTLSRLHSGLYARLAFLALRGEYAKIEQLGKRSPFTVLDWRPREYLGEFDHLPDPPDSGRWLFDRSLAELVYVPRLHRNLTSVSTGGPLLRIRFRVELSRDATYGYKSISVRPLDPYRWDPIR